METLGAFFLKDEYRELEKLGDPLAEFDPLIDWEAFRPIVAEMFDNKSDKGGRPNIDEVLMIKSLFLQEMYSLSDPQLEFMITDRISFRKFLGILGVPDAVPDFSTFWKFRERLATTGKHKAIWKEFQHQLDSKGLKVKKGVIQDATFITSDPGHAKADTPRGDEARTRRSKDGTWVKKGQKSFFGYKLHSKSDVEYGLIREIKTTTASLHDSQVDLSFRKEVVYRDKGYVGAGCSGWSATMERSTRGHPIGIRSKLRNIRIGRIRSPGERPYSVIKRTFGSGHVMVTTVERVDVKNTFVAMGYNLFNLRTLKRKGVIS